MIYYLFIYYLIILSMLFFLLSLYFLINKMVLFYEIELLKLISVKLEYLILLDWISLMFVSVVMMISSMVIFYSIEYMKFDIFMMRFIYLIMLFVISMILMILSPNMISILLGWDGLGLVSYCLVIYYHNENSYNAGMITVLTNRVGDILILMLIGLMLFNGSWNFMFFKNLDFMMMILLMIAAFTKSAQIPFSSWLPMAMAAPTPVSSLVHSSTLVTAGVYLLIRFNYLIEDLMLMKLMMYISLMTMFMSGMGANLENDLKKIIALSTLSQLGVMIFCLSLKLSEICFFHLLMHAMFKSMLFMCSGVIIHSMMGNQDIRFISMITYNMPMISMIFNCASFSLCGVPFLSGFFSKDLILEMYLMNLINLSILMILFISMGLTIMYSLRLLYYSFIKLPKINIFWEYKSSKSLMIYSMIFLYFMSIISGISMSWFLFSLKNLIYLTMSFKMLIYFFMMIGMLLGVILSQISLSMNVIFLMNLYIKFFSMMWFISLIYNMNIFKIFNFSSEIINFIDYGWSEYMLGNNLKIYLNKFLKMDLFNKNYFYLLIFIMYFLMILIF